MDFRLASAMRGPDSETKAAGAWKLFVTAPLRWLAAKVLKRAPSVWAQGDVTDPADILQDLEDKSFKCLVSRAKRFAESSAGFHVKAHANSAFNYLEGTPYKAIANKLEEALRTAGLL